MIFIFAIMKTRREKNRSTAAAALGKHESVIVAVQNGVARESQNGLQGTPMRRSSFWRCRTANQRQRNAARRILEPFLVCSALASPDAGMHQYAFQVEELSVPVQWSQVVDHIGHPDRAAARMCGHLGNLASSSAPMVEPGENQSSYSFSL